VSTSRVFLAAAGAVLVGCAPASDPDPRVDPYAACYPAHEKAGCIRDAEARRIRGAGGRVVRDGAVLRITPAGGAPVVLADDSTEGFDYERYRYRAFLRRAGYHLVEVTFWESTGFLLVSDRTGSATQVPEAPLFSPDGTRFASVSMDLAAFYEPNRVEIWKASREKPALEWELDLDGEAGSPEWGPSDARWLDDRTLEFVKNEPTDDPEVLRRTRMRLRLQGGRWVLEENYGE
jgi:hypothetical protein